MTRLVPIDRPLVFGDVIAYYSNPETKDRNIYLGQVGSNAFTLELVQSTGFIPHRDGVDMWTAATMPDIFLLVEEDDE